jgi:hypothetical protein
MRLPSEEAEFTMTESHRAESDIPELSQADIDSLGSKLAAWAETLSGAERAIAQQLVERTRELTPASVAVGNIAIDLTASALALIKNLNLPASPIAWAKTGPSWQQNLPRLAAEYDYYGDQFALIQRVDVTLKK